MLLPRSRLCCDIIGIRSFPGLVNREQDYQEQVLQKFKDFSAKPIINLESATVHPLQSLADAITIDELKTKANPKIVLTWAPHVKALPQSVANSFASWMLKWGADLTIANPEGYDLCTDFTQGAKIVHDQDVALADADFVYCKNWSSYQSYGNIIPVKQDWQVTAEKMSLTDSGKFMHCLPVRRNLVVSDDVLNSSETSVVIQQASNRVYSAAAVLNQMLDSEC